ncbi:hypothetical protein SK803_44210 [Lentzea sp. BCCO 10_0856]|uniref:Lipoprotein n=1 Tax=Lentzea miocenica TaxID=3095431 RepID=A0ABU4TGG6_9PSEU|nr:hypothetical protein [Lentzea sp. BCCO 10_0856]MDX8037241.1 hypothetical protein [Lentzea sp. BCCO 10_0856]
MTRLKLVAVLTAVTALGGCSPMPTWAAKLTPTGLPQFVDNACDSPKVEWMQIQGTDGDVVLDEKDPVLWRVEFAPPARLREITVAQKPEGAVEKVAWQPPKGDQHLAMSVKRENADASHIEFTLDGLKDGKAKYEDEYLTADEFAKKRVSC